MSNRICFLKRYKKLSKILEAGYSMIRKVFFSAASLGVQVMVLICFMLASHALASEPVVYAWAEHMADDKRGLYPIELLKLALEKSGKDYRAIPSRHDKPQWRTLRQLELGIDMDVVWTFTSPEREVSLRAIRIPIDRGLLGWRLLLIRQSDAEKFAQMESADALKNLRAGQGHDWPDYPILKHNGFKVSPSSSYEGLFHMLILGRIQHFPRSMTEIQAELDARPQMPLMIAPKWALYYPAPLYFFVKRDSHALAIAIEQGLLVAMHDGSMRKLFEKHFGEDIIRANLKNRRVVRLENPLLTPETPLQRADLWFSPERGF